MELNVDTLDHGLYIDGTYFDVNVLKVDRKASFIWKYAERTEDGEHRGELLGVYFNYTLTMANIQDRDEYNLFYKKLTEAVEYHEVKMPGRDGSMFSFQAYFADISDSVKHSRKGKNVFQELKVEFIAKKPAVIPA